MAPIFGCQSNGQVGISGLPFIWACTTFPKITQVENSYTQADHHTSHYTQNTPQTFQENLLAGHKWLGIESMGKRSPLDEKVCKIFEYMY